MLECFDARAAAGAGGVGVIRPPGGMGGQVALVGAHLVKTSSDKFVQAHEGVGVEAARVRVVVGGGWRESHSLNMRSRERTFRAL